MTEVEHTDTTLLINLSREGNAAAIETLVRTYESRIFRLALSMLDDPAEADEATLGTFITALQRLNTYRGEASFVTWLYAIGWNVCRGRLRKRRARERLEDCATRAVPTDRPFWANQADFAPGQLVYGQQFLYANDVPEADRLVIRVNLIEPGVNGRLLYCTQQVYQLLPGSTPITPTPPTPQPYVTSSHETPPPSLTLIPDAPIPTSAPPTPAPTFLLPVTPQAGLLIKGYVRLVDGTGLANVKIYRAFASYGGRGRGDHRSDGLLPE